LPLVDGLHFCVLARPPRYGVFALPRDATLAAGAGRVFRDAFNGVWQRIPQFDRECLTSYWRTRPSGTLYGYCEPTPRHLPFIIVVESDPDPDEPYVCRKFGFELRFPAGQVLGPPEGLSREIALALVETFRYATRQHSALALSMLEEPIERWERRRQCKATEEEYDRKWAALLKPYRRAYEQEVAEILGRWGLGDGAVDQHAASGGCKRANKEA
jgi:hypothetical protein